MLHLQLLYGVLYCCIYIMSTSLTYLLTYILVVGVCVSEGSSRDVSKSELWTEGRWNTHHFDRHSPGRRTQSTCAHQ